MVSEQAGRARAGKHSRRHVAVLALRLILGCVGLWGCAPSPRTESTQTMEQLNRVTATKLGQDLINAYSREIRPLEIETAWAWWRANTSGKDEDFQAKEAAQNRLDAALGNPMHFMALKRLHERGTRDLDLVGRQVELLYLMHLEKQVSPEILRAMTAKANAVEQAFNVYRAEVDGKLLTDNAIRDILKTSLDSGLRQRAWEASKAVGGKVVKDLLELVRLRNAAAKELGFHDYHAMQLALNEQQQHQVVALFDQLDALTRAEYAKVKDDLDTRLAASFNIKKDALRPWHYSDLFFQEAPAVFGLDPDAVYQGVDLVAVTRAFYASIGLPVDDVIRNSDLFEKPGKSPHAFCTDIDRSGDNVRVLANVVSGDYWMSTLMHEFGHAVYSSKNIPDSLPPLLRTEGHILATEGIAMMFERLNKSATWLTQMGIHVADPAAFDAAQHKMERAKLLIFSRWCQVMLRFELGLYADPNQDLNKLWWDLVEKYQLIKRPEGRNAPDYASKIHIVSAPAYYHNYMMGQLFASQLHHTIASVVEKLPPRDAVYVGNPEVGRFISARVFAPGRSINWDDLTYFATGERLRPEAFAEDFRDKNVN